MVLVLAQSRVVWPNGSTTMPNVSSGFGRRDPSIPGASRNHLGVDLTGFDIVGAVDAGLVVASGTPIGWAGGGQQVWVQHGGYFTRCLHLSQRYVSYGDRVTAGQPLGVMGRTGTATGVHLHLELTPGDLTFWNSGQVDPVPFLTDRIRAGSSAGGGGTPFPPKEVIDMAGIPALVVQDNGTVWKLIDQDTAKGVKVAKRQVLPLEMSVYRALAEKLYPAEKEKAINRFIATGIALSQIPNG